MLSLKLDDESNADWTNIFVPLWIFYGIWFMNLLFDLFSVNIIPIYFNKKYHKNLYGVYIEFILFVGLFVFSILLLKDLDLIEDYEKDEMDILIIFIPIFSSLTLIFLSNWIREWFRKRQ